MGTMFVQSMYNDHCAMTMDKKNIYFIYEISHPLRYHYIESVLSKHGVGWCKMIWGVEREGESRNPGLGNLSYAPVSLPV